MKYFIREENLEINQFNLVCFNLIEPKPPLTIS